MFITVLSFLGSQLLFILVFGLIELTRTRNLQRALQREQMEQDAQDARLERYLRFLAVYRTIWQTGNSRTGVVLLLILAGIGLVFPALSLVGLGLTAPGSFQILQIEHLLVLALVIGFIVGGFTSALTRLLKVDLKASHFFESTGVSYPSATNTRYLIAKTIQLLILILACEALAAVIMVGGNLSLAFPLFGVVITCVLLLWPAVVSSRLDRSLPALEDTPWSALAPRLAAWAQLAGVEYEAARLRQEPLGTLGHGVWHPVWHPRRSVLILSETLLRHAEWRQQDAMLAALVCQILLVQGRHPLLRHLLSLLVLWMSMAGLPFLQIWLFPVTGLFTLVPQLIFFFSLSLISRSLLSFPPQATFTLDRLSAFLTGDPLAVMVAMKLREALSWLLVTKPSTSDPSKQKQQRTSPPSTHQRMLKLAEVMRQEWPRAPQTVDPVPAIITVYAGPHLITAPFDQATSAAPVPASPYGGKDLFHQQHEKHLYSTR